jgi:hypothetical protein
MNISSPTDMARFVSANELVHLDQNFSQLVNCINNYAVACNCHKKEDKDKLYGVCTRLYLDGARHVVSRFKHQFLAKTTDRQIAFYTEQGQLIVIMSR